MAMNRAELRAEIQINRRDPGLFLHLVEEYNSAINQALRDVPEGLWVIDFDTSLTTVDEQRRYTTVWAVSPDFSYQVRNVWMETSEEHYAKIGRWTIEDDGGALTLILDEDPPEAGRTLRVEYLAPHDELSDDVTDATMDADWLILRATTLLLLKADPRLEDPAMIQADLQRFDALRQSRERELLQRVRLNPRKARTKRRG